MTIRENLEGLLGALSAAPDDTAARLVLADTLAEQGHPLGELISLQLSGGDPARERELLSKLETSLCELVAPGAFRAWCANGLPEVAWYSSRALLGVRAARFPLLRQVKLTVARGELARSLLHPLLKNVRALSVVANAANEVVHGACPAGLTSLSVSGFPMETVAALVASAPALERLHLCERELSPKSLTWLRGRRLRRLELERVLAAPDDVAFLRELAATIEDFVVHAADPDAALALANAGFRAHPAGAFTLGASSHASGVNLTSLLARDESFEGWKTDKGFLVSAAPMGHSLDIEPVELASFVAEVRAQRTLEPLFPRTLGAGFVEGAPFVHLEDLDGAPLSAVLDAGGKTPELRRLDASRELVTFFAVLAQRLEGAPVESLTSSPLYLVRALEPRLAAGWSSGATDRASFTRSTCPRLSPELTRGGRYSPASVVFALGVHLFEALAGRLPHRDAASTMGILNSVVNGELDTLGPRAGVPAELAELVNALLAREPGARPRLADAAVKLSALSAQLPSNEAALSGRLAVAMTAARPAFTIERPWRWVNRT